MIMPDHPLCLQLGGSLSMLLQSDKGDMGLAIGDVDQFVKEGSTDSDFPPMTGKSPFDDEYNYIRSIAKRVIFTIKSSNKHGQKEQMRLE